MLKDILIKCFTLTGRDDLAIRLSGYNKILDITDQDLLKEVQSLISHFNFVSHSTFEHYLEFEKSNLVSSNDNRQIDYSKLSSSPVFIKGVEDENYKKVNYTAKTEFLLVPMANTAYYVIYNAIPDEVTELTSDTSHLSSLTEKIIIFGTVSGYLASKGKFAESEYFEKKFFNEAFKIKSKRERRLKSTFCLWEKLLNFIIFTILI